jgi:invasion protein IalB
MQKPTKKAYFSFSHIAAAAMVAVLPAQSVRAEENVSETFGAWDLRCQLVPETKIQNCALTQTATSKEHPDTSLGVMVMRPAALKTAVMRILVPLDVYLIGGATLSATDGDIGKAAFSKCTPGGCWADIALEDKTFDGLKNKGEMRLTIYKTPHESLSYQFKSDGLSEGFEKLRSSKAQ